MSIPSVPELIALKMHKHKHKEITELSDELVLRYLIEESAPNLGYDNRKSYFLFMYRDRGVGGRGARAPTPHSPNIFKIIKN